MRGPPPAFARDIVSARISLAVADRRFTLFGNLMLALAVVGYPLSAAVSQLMGAESNVINIAFRATILASSLLLGIWSLMRGQYRFDGLLLVFLTIYTVRMVLDLAYSGFPDIEDDFQFYVATTLAPTLALGAGHVWYEERTCARWIAGIGGFAGVLITYTLIFNPDTALLEALGDRAAFKFLNPISISYHGLYIAAAALILIASPGGPRKILIWGAVAGLGGYLLVAGGSRGPFVALVLAVGLTSIANTRTAGTYAILGIGVVVLLVAVGAPELIVQRFLSAGDDASSLERFNAIQLSLQAAIDHPLLGYAYIEPITGNYPHNLLIEAAMALGMVGAALMLWMEVSLIISAWRLARRGEWLLPFLAATSFANAWISGAIWGSGLFLAILWIARGRVRMLTSLQSRRAPRRT
ncbi:MAG: O-antigen ligase family protein [Pontixanthobacter sp.]